MSDKIHNYESETITVQYELKRCIHAEECVQRLQAVFDRKRRRWIDPQNASADAIADTIHQCPTGALTYTRKDGGTPEGKPTENIIHLTEDSALYVRGEIHMNGAIYYRVALCRCGESNNKPFCDNSHLRISFETDGLVDESQREVSDITGGGALKITPERYGPYWVQGDFEIVDVNGVVAYRGSENWLCRCGGSSNKPFCDNTHKKIGFQAEGE
jgi:CDGSH-type Zn-finger protein/uncharacterized Fe-S cluster protein YjdI